ncbi:helix-turn-helix domain-containing protein [Alteromonadaceae bacterium BrNp21-10]|nr:helix-turn-helix domain-containing protein [Alteromonadaceae bacterium BrNp21-10]
MTQTTTDYASCPVETTLALIQGKWKVVIMFRLKDQPRRFNELSRLLPDITQRMLTNQLRELEKDGLLHREVFPEVPPKVIYSLTDLALSLMPLMLSIKDWGRNHLDGQRQSCNE